MQKRIFFAFPVPTAIRTSLEFFKDSVGGERVRFVKPENYHITLSFFGEQEASFIPQLVKVVTPIFSETPAFTLSFDRIALAPPQKKPTMIWAEYQRHPEATNLAREIETTAAQVFDFPDRRQGHEILPHITIARFKGPSPEVLPQIKLDALIMKECNLYESTSTLDGLTYVPLYTFHLHNS